MSKKVRCFISINFPKEVQDEIKKIQDALPFFIGKKTKIENLHLTLKFLGEIDEKKIESIKKSLRTIKFNKFETKIKGGGVFSESFVRIVWLHLFNCEELQEKIDEKLFDIGFEKEKRFMSHLTIARVKGVEDKKRFLEELRVIQIPKINFKVNEFYLMKSELSSKDPTYSIIKEYGLI